MKIYNTLTRRKEEFVPIEEGKVKMYVCGPTVYNYFHIGNARPFVVFDTMRKYLEYRGYKVKFVQNFTDVDDKIINRAKEEGISAPEVSEKYIAEYYKDAAALNVKKATVHPQVSKTIDDIIKFVQDLIDKGYAYESEGDVYYRTRKFEGYGKLSGKNIEDLIAGARIAVGEKKEDPLDFALWKARKEDSEIAWESPWGMGRPGWHIECSAMAKKFLGETIDIHAGGADLIFPHHENEIAQSECANGCKFVNYWLHNGFVTINKEKMYKYLKNFVTIGNLLENYDANTIRLFILTNHYRMPVEFCDSALEGAKSGWKRIQTGVNQVLKFAGNIELPDVSNTDEVKAFKEAMDNDLNTSKALAVIFDTVTNANKAVSDKNIDDAKKYAAILVTLTNVLGFKVEKEKLSEQELEEKLSKKYNKNVTLENKVDETILGGVLVRLGNTLIDGSVKTRLDNIKDQLSQVIS